MEVAAVALLEAARGRRARKKRRTRKYAAASKSHWRCGGQVGSKRMGIAFVELEKETAMGTGA